MEVTGREPDILTTGSLGGSKTDSEMVRQGRVAERRVVGSIHERAILVSF
jgi:hypothetical protein